MPEYKSHVTASLTLGADVATAGTFNVSYPTGYDESMMDEAGHKISVKNGGDYTSPHDFTVAFGAANAVVTWNDSLTLSAGTELFVELNVKGHDGDIDLREFNAGKVSKMTLVSVNLGAPDAADANGYVESQNLTAAGVFSVSTTAAAAIAAAALAGTADVPRNVVAAWTGTAVLTVTGTDEYGNTVVESSASGTSMAGKKAFKTITDISTSANITGLTVGTGDVLGLPVYLPDADLVLSEQEDGAAATAGTLVAGINTKATATTGDVRGTYDPNSACDGDKNFALVVAMHDPNYKGGTQYGG